MFYDAALFVTAYLLTWQALIIALIIGIAFEHGGHRKSAVFAGLVAMGISYFYFAVPLKTIWYYVALYFVVGLGWSFLRYGRFLSEKVASLSKRQWDSQEEKEQAVQDLAPINNLERITSWIIVWPFSVIENTLGDIITAIQSLVTRFFKGVYHRIFVSQTEALLNRVEPTKPAKD